MSDNKAPKPLARVAKIEATLDRLYQEERKNNDNAGLAVVNDERRERLLCTVLIEQAIDRLTYAVNRQTANLRDESHEAREIREEIERMTREGQTS